MRRNDYDKKTSRNKSLKKSYERELLTLVKKIGFQGSEKAKRADEILQDFFSDRSEINARAKATIGIKTIINKNKNVELIGLFNSVKVRLEKLKKE